MTQAARPSAGAIVAAVFVGVWALVVTVPLQALGWLGDQLLVVYAGTVPEWAWPVANLVNAGLVGVPALLLARFARSSPAVRATGRTWLVAASGLGLLGLVRGVPSAEAELQLALLAAGAVALSLLWRERPAPPSEAETAPPSEVETALPSQAETAPPSEAGTGQVLVAGAGGLLILAPWLWVGALGGALETLLAVAAAAGLGWLAATALNHRFWDGYAASRPLLVLAGGLVAGVGLLLLAAGAGASGAQLALMLVLPPLGFAAAALRRAWPVAVLVGLAALGPLALVDPGEISLLLTATRDVPFWAGLATAVSLVLALLLGLGYLFGLLRPGRPARARQWPRPVAGVVAAVTVIAAAGIYLGPGQPGLHGERLFVVMADQADLSGVPSGAGQAGRDARAGEVYRRLVEHAEASQAGLREELDRFGLSYTPYYLVNGIQVAGGPAVRAWLSRRDDVDRVLRTQRLRPLPAAGGPSTGTAGLTPSDPEWNITMIQADRVWDELGVTGEGIAVGSSDSGVDGAHPALAAGYRAGDDSWLDPWNHTADPTDHTSHGTHTLGSAVGRGGIGVAPGSQWTGCVNLDRGLGNPAHYLDCLQFMLAPYPQGGDPWRDGRPERAPHVLTNSWGCPPIEGCDAGVLRPATAALQAAGLYLVVAAGNAGPFCESIQDPPAPDPDVLTVGAVDRDQQVTFFSSRGPVPGAEKPDLVAPGAAVVSAMPGGGYAAQEGTSMATPHVAGVVALMWSANPDLIGDLDRTTRILRDTTRPASIDEVACGGEEALAGAGLVDAHAAVAAAIAD